MQDNPTTAPTPDETEEWRPIVSYEGLYSVSNFGRVRRDAAGPGTRIGRIFKTKPHANTRYCHVDLCRNGAIQTHNVHKLVMAAFVGPYPEGLTINHIDGNPSNNHVSNLEYVTRSENAQHAVRLGLMESGDRHWSKRYPERYRRGESHGNATLTDRDVQDIRSALASGEKGNVLARRYGVGQSTISRIKRGLDRFSAQSSLETMRCR